MSDLPSPGENHTAFHTPLSLLERIRRRDQEAWAHFHHVYSPLIYHICRRWRVTGADADDVAQDAFRALVQNIGTYEREQNGQPRSFRNWLGGIVRNVLLAHLHRRAAGPPGEGGDGALERLRELAAPTGPPEDDFDPQVDREICRRALSRVREGVPAGQWQAFWRTCVDGLPAPAVAEELGMTPAAVRQAKCRLLRRLREELGDEPGALPVR